MSFARVAFWRLLRLLVTVVSVTIATFAITNVLPGDPARLLLGDQATAENVAKVRQDLGLNGSAISRYWSWLTAATTGDLGESYRTGQPVLTSIRERAMVTFEIGLGAIALSLLVAVPIATLTAYRRGRPLDRATTGLSFGLLSIPSFVHAIGLIFVFSLTFEVFPATGWVPLTESIYENLRHAALPIVALALTECPLYVRILRSDLITVLKNDHVTLARAKGISTCRLLVRHTLRPASLSIITVVGLNLGAVMGGTVLVETIFALPGIGRLLVDSVLQRDLPVIQGVVLIVAVTYVLVNFVVDMVYTIVDPRTKGSTIPRTATRGAIA